MPDTHIIYKYCLETKTEQSFQLKIETLLLDIFEKVFLAVLIFEFICVFFFNFFF
jgi:hypothetical protein